MKKNVKLILFAGVLICLAILFVCDLTGYHVFYRYPPRSTYEFSQPEDQIKTIDVVYIYPFSNAPSDEVEVVNTVTEIVNSDPQKFLEGLREVPCYLNYRVRWPDIEKDVIRITYQDGSYELIGATGVYYINVDGVAKCCWYCFDEMEFQKFMYKCVDESFENK